MRETVGLYLLAILGRGRVVGRVRVTIQMYRRNPMDSDNAKGACKVMFDALVRLGWAKDDSEKWMEQVVLPVIVDRKKPPRMSVTVENLAR